MVSEFSFISFPFFFSLSPWVLIRDGDLEHLETDLFETLPLPCCADRLTANPPTAMLALEGFYATIGE